MKKPFLIALDWGSTRFRGWLLDPNGIEIDKIDKEFGILKVNQSQYLDVFEKSGLITVEDPSYINGFKEISP